MPSWPTATQAERFALGLGASTLAIGVALTLAPERAGSAVGLTDPLGARLVGVADVALAPGLMIGAPRWPWLARRAALNLVIVAYGERLGGRATVLARSLALGAALDAYMALRLRADEVA